MATFIPFSAIDHHTGSEIGVERYTKSGFNATLPYLAAGFAATQGLDLLVEIPDPLPSGTAKIRLAFLAEASSGAVEANTKCKTLTADVGSGGDAVGQTLTDNGAISVTWGTGDEGVIQYAKDTVVETVVAGETLEVSIDFDPTNSTIASKVYILWGQSGILFE